MSIEELTERLTMSGLNLEEYREIEGDIAIDLEVTSNRPDCLGHIGVAREIAALYATTYETPQVELSESAERCAEQISVEVEVPELCQEYHARVIRGVRIGPSPRWLRDRLNVVGINSVNNVVDVTNYVMLETGQPLHAFDLDRLQGSGIRVRRARPGETITAIDQRQYQLSPDMCVIADAARAAAVAGVMGGQETEISGSTVNVLVEAAAFAPLAVRSTARSLKLHSPSSYRFERRVDRTQLDWVSRRCCQLICQVAGGTVQAGSVAGGEPEPREPRLVSLRYQQVTRLLGITIAPRRIQDILQSLGLKLLKHDAETAQFAPPGWRQDLRRECDLIEEVARINGYQNIPDNVPLPMMATGRTVRERVLDGIRGHLTSQGFYEAITLSFVSEAHRTLFQPRGERPDVSVSHTSRSHENRLRQSLIPSLLQSRRQNERHGTADAELFEVGKVYLSAGQNQAEHTAEPTMAGIVSSRTFLSLKGIVESLVHQLAPHAVMTAEPGEAREFQAGRNAVLLLNGTPFGWLGELDRTVTDSMDLAEAATVAEFDVHALESVYEPNRRFRTLPRYPPVSRDLNFVLAESVSWAKLSNAVKQQAGDILQGVSFGGQYQGPQIAAEHKSYVVTCRFQAADRTLTAEEVEEAVQRIVSGCQTGLAARLR